MEKAKDGAKLIPPGRQESMHFETALTLPRKAVRLYRQAGQPHTGKENSTPGLTQRWRIEINTEQEDNEQSGFKGPLIEEIGFTSTIQNQPTNNLEEAPLSSSMDLENVILTDKSTISRATKQLKLIAAVNQGKKAKLLSRNLALANLSGGRWKEFDIHQNQIPTGLIDACYTQQVE